MRYRGRTNDKCAAGTSKTVILALLLHVLIQKRWSPSYYFIYSKRKRAYRAIHLEIKKILAFLEVASFEHNTCTWCSPFTSASMKVTFFEENGSSKTVWRLDTPSICRPRSGCASDLVGRKYVRKWQLLLITIMRQQIRAKQKRLVLY